MNWQEELPAGAVLVRQHHFSYSDPDFPQEIQILANETLAGAPKPAAVLAVVTSKPQRAHFVEQPRGWGTAVDEAVLNCIRCARKLLIIEKPRDDEASYSLEG